MKFLVVVVIVAGGLVAGDAWVRATAEERVAATVQRNLDRNGEANVELGGFPFTLRLLSGSIPDAEIRSDALSRDGVRLSDVRMHLQEIQFSLSDALRGDAGSLVVGSGRGQAQLGPSALTALFDALDSRVDVELSGGRIEASVGPISGEATLAVDGRDLSLSLEGFDRAFTVGLPRFATGLTYDQVRVRGGRAVIAFRFDNARFHET